MAARREPKELVVAPALAGRKRRRSAAQAGRR